MMGLSSAEGEKPRLGGRLLPGAFAPAADASIRVLPLAPPIQYLVMTVLLVFPNS
jgi:hypothetical protein